MVVYDLLIGVHGGLRPVGPDDGLHPVLQPVGQVHLLPDLLLWLPRLPLPLGVKVPQPVPGGRQRGKGPVLLDPLPVLVPAQLHADIVKLPHIVIGYIPFYCFSCHGGLLLDFSLWDGRPRRPAQR